MRGGGNRKATMPIPRRYLQAVRKFPRTNSHVFTCNSYIDAVACNVSAMGIHYSDCHGVLHSVSWVYYHQVSMVVGESSPISLERHTVQLFVARPSEPDVL